MQINKNNSNKKRIIILVSVILLATVAGGGYLFFTQNTNQPENSSSVTTTNAPAPSESDKKQTENLEKDPGNKSTPVNTDPTPQPAPGGTNSKKAVQMVSSFDSDATNVYIRGGVNTLVYDGVCYALLTGPSGTVIKKETTLMQSAATTDCKTIAIKKSELAPGKWTFTLNYNSPSMDGKSNEQTFSF